MAPPGTTDVGAPAVAHFTPTPFAETSAPAYHERRSGSVDRYHRRSPAEYEERGAPARAYKEPPADDHKKPRDHERRRSRERHSHHREPEQHRKRHHSRLRAPSQSPPGHRNRKHRSRGRSVDKENKASRADRGVSNKRESPDRGDEPQRHHVPHEKADQEEKRLEPDDRKDEHKEKKEKSKRKKKKESEVEKKKRKKVKTSKKEESKAEETLPAVKAESDDANDEQPAPEEPKSAAAANDALYGDLEGAAVDTSIIENYGKLESEEPEKPPKKELILAAVPELSKWERDDVSSPSEERAGARRTSDDKKMVTSEILKRAENALFQKSTSKSQSKEAPAAPKEDPLESTREARKSGNSIQVTVPAVGSKAEDESRLAALGRVSAKDRLGAKVEEKNYATVRSLVEPKIKSRAVSSTVKCVTDVKHSLKSEADRLDREKRAELRRAEEKRRREKERHSEKPRHRGDPKEKKEEHHARKEKERRSKHEESRKESADPVASTNSTTDKPSDSASVNEAKSILEKKRPCLDEATFEPDYDLTSESEGEIEKERKGIEPEEPVKKSDLEKNAEKATPKTKEPSNEATSSESSSDSSSDSSAERRKRKKRKSKKKKRVKKRKTYSTDSESEESSESDSDSDGRSKRKKKHRHKTKKASRSAKKKKRTKHR